MKKKRVLVCCDYYLPGFKSGGGMLTIANMIERFAGEYDFYIFTRNHDGRNDPTPYKEVETGKWNQLGNTKVFYSAPRKITSRKLAEIVSEIRPDAVFLNSAFSKTTRSFLEARRRKSISELPVILAPCGELSTGSLSLKPLKKKLFLGYAKAVGLYDGVIWKASFELEEQEIREQLDPDAEVMVAADLTPLSILSEFDESRKPAKQSGSAKFAFLSRIMRKKNLHFLLELLTNIDDGEVLLEVIGPVEDEEYWRQCESIIKELPQNIRVDVTGGLDQPEALRRLEQSHFFVLPTLHENFGYVFIEALAAGCPILISENTAWNQVGEKGIGWVTPLARPQTWIGNIKQCIAMEAAEYQRMSSDARNFAVSWLRRPEHEEATAAVFERALGKNFNFAVNES